MHQERQKWNELENLLRDSITAYWQEFHETDFEDAINIYGKIINENTTETERRLFFDWFIHDYPISYKNNSNIIKLCLNEFEKEYDSDLIEMKTLRNWSNSFFRFVEILEIIVGTGYKVSDIFTKEEFFIHDIKSSSKVKKYDLAYIRIYKIENIKIIGSGLTLIQRKYLSVIKKYIINDMKMKHYEIDINNSDRFNLNLEKYLKNESLSLIKYLDLLSNQSTANKLTTVQGDIAALSESYFAIKRKRNLISILNSSEYFTSEYYKDHDDEYDDNIIRYDWIEKLDSIAVPENINEDDQYRDEEIAKSDQVELNTVLWLPDSLNNKRKHSRSKNEKLVPCKVLGNLSINGKILTISCMSDKLLKRCNDIVKILLITPGTFRR